jgi:hypothetical protein
MSRGLGGLILAPGGQGVAGSNPVSPTMKSRKLTSFRDFSFFGCLLKILRSFESWRPPQTSSSLLS